MCIPVSRHVLANVASVELPSSHGNQASCLRRWSVLACPTLVLVFVGGMCFLPALSAQKDSHCEGPPALEKAIAEHPTAAAYDALGAHFAGQSKFSCAISAFRTAVRLDPNSWQGHYNLGVALLTSGNAKQAAADLTTASKLNP